MKYVKPAVENLGLASLAIQQQVGHKGGFAEDAIESERPKPSTGLAYDLDE